MFSKSPFLLQISFKTLTFCIDFDFLMKRKLSRETLFQTRFD
jgi:hypothetical protein